MTESMEDYVISKERFVKLYEEENGFKPSFSRNGPKHESNNIVEYYDLLEEGCDILIKSNPELVHVSEEDK